MTPLLLLCLLLTSPALACNSYEECMSDKGTHYDGLGGPLARKVKPPLSNNDLALRAIAFKLSEISEKLNAH